MNRESDKSETTVSKKIVKILIEKRTLPHPQALVDKFEESSMEQHMIDIEAHPRNKTDLAQKRRIHWEKKPNNHPAIFLSPRAKDEIWWKCSDNSIPFRVIVENDPNYIVTNHLGNPFMIRTDGPWLKATFLGGTDDVKALAQCFYKFTVQVAGYPDLDPHINVDDDHETIMGRP